MTSNVDFSYNLNVEEPYGLVLQDMIQVAARRGIAAHHRIAPIEIELERIGYAGDSNLVWAEYRIGQDPKVRYSHGMRFALEWKEDR